MRKAIYWIVAPYPWYDWCGEVDAETLCRVVADVQAGHWVRVCMVDRKEYPLWLR